MAVETNSEAWSTAETDESLMERILEFLQEYPNRAYSIEEITDEVVDTNWELEFEIERKRNELGEEEFFDRRRDGELADKFDRPTGQLLDDRFWTHRVGANLDRLEDEGEIERRKVDIENSDVPYDWEDVSYYTYSG